MLASKFPETAASYQLYVGPGAVAVKVADEPGQIVALATVGAAGFGLTVMLNTKAVPTHELADGVTDITAVTDEAVELTDVNDGMLPVPDAAIPIDGAEFVQLKTVEGIVPVNVEAGTVLPAQ